MKHPTRFWAVIGLFCAASLALAPVYGASLSISGTVKDADGKASAGADVYAVSDAKVKATSGADGTFSLKGTIPDVPGKTKVPVAAAKAGCMTAQVLAPGASAKDLQVKLYPALTGAPVTLMGLRMSHVHVREDAQWENAGGSKKEGGAKLKFLFLMAFDGPPGIKAEYDQIWADYHPDSSLDGDAAKELEGQFKARLMFYLDGPMVDEKLLKAHNYGGGALMSITGTVHEQDGKKYITATAFGDYKGPTYPERLMGPDKPLVKLPVKPGLTIKLADKLSDTLIYVPAGKLYMGCPLEQTTHWQEAPQHMVTLTKGIYMSDHPILNSEYAAVTGDTTRNPKNYPPDAAVNISCEMFDAYVKALQKLNPGKVIRAPTKAEWEYAARSGTSDLSFSVIPKNRDFNFGNRYGETCDRTVPVKSKKPNSWGFYGMMFSDGSERSCDAGFFSDQTYIPAMTDPRYPMQNCVANPAKDHVHANGGNTGYPIQELLNDNSNVGKELGGDQRNRYLMIRQRFVVEE